MNTKYTHVLPVDDEVTRRVEDVHVDDALHEDGGQMHGPGIRAGQTHRSVAGED